MADTNIKWNGTPIDSIERDSLSLDRINENGTIREMVDTINANFLNIAKHGGGPAGIDGTDGSNGVDGSNAEYIYALCDEMKPDVQYPTNAKERKNLFNSVKSAGSYTYKGVTWFDNAQPISPDYKNEYVWTRIKRGTSSTEWYYASEPVLWSHWGETGKDGDGVEYIFLASSNELTSIALNTSLLKIENMDDFQKVIFNIDDFYPGKKWFSSGNNKQKARLAISKKGLKISDSVFDTRWGQYFNFCNDTYSWTDEPTGTGPSVLYEYVSIRKSTTDENDIKTWGDFSTPALWSNYNLPTKTVIIYCNLNEDVTPESPTGGWVDMSTGKLITNKSGYELTPDYWKDTNDDVEENQITWMSTGVFDYTGKNTYWSSPVRVTGRDGKNGEDGTLVEFIYTLTTSGTQPDYPTITDKTQLDTLFDAVENSTTSPKYSTYGSSKWYDRAQAISVDNPVEYMAQRSKNPDETEWTYTEPIIWAHWGEDGTDGDGVEYIFATTKTDSNSGLVLPVYSSLNDSQKKIFQIDDFVPSTEWFNKSKSKQKAQEILGESFSNTEWNNQYGFNVSSGWSDNPIEVSPSAPYQWVSIRRSHADENTGDRFWEDFSTPVLWNSYGKRTRTFVVYCNMSDETTPQSPTGGWWDTTSDGLWMSKTNSGEYKSNALQSGTPNYTSYVGYWSDNNIDVRGTITWISTGEFNDSIDENGSNNISWSKPFRITGETGEPGADGSNREFVYALCDDKDSLKYPQNSSDTVKNNFFDSVENAGTNGYTYEGTTWYDHPQGVANENGKRTEWVWSRSKPAGDSETTQWETSPVAVIWSHWGEDGTDGDGVEYIFARSTQKPLDDIDKPYKVSELSTDAQKVIYNINDFYPGEGWFTSDNKVIAKKAIEDAGISMTTTQFNTQWTNRFNLIKTSSDPNVIVCQWWDNPRGVDLEHPYEFVSIRKSSIDENGKKVWGDFSDPTLWAEYPIKSRTFIVYCNVDEGTTPDRPLEGDFTWDVQNDRLVKSQNSSTIWSDTDIDVPGKIAWLCSGLFAENGNVISWSAPFRITGEQGKKGADGSTVEFVYTLSDTMPNFPDSTISYTDRCNFFDSVEHTPEGFVYNGTKWFDTPQGIADEDGKRKEWVWSRNKSAGDSGVEWTFPENPVIWAHWGEDGTDGDGVEYMFLLGNFDTYNSPTENEWNTFFSSNFTDNSVSDIAKYVYATSDFLPTTDWFDEHKNTVKTNMEAEGKEFDDSAWTTLRGRVNSAQLGTWKDNPGNVSVSNKYQYVSIRKMNDGVWGAFSYPKLWSKYATIKFKSIAFAATTFDTDLSSCTVTGGSFSNPIPTTTKDSQNNTVNVVWTDGPQPDASTGKTQIWMTSANVSEDSTSALVWSAPQKMTDTSDLQVEWSPTDKTLAELASINNSLTASKYNFGVLLQSNSYSENAAELAWRALMQDDFNISFNDNSENAILMATSQLKNGVWTDWKITRVKGEKGDAGTSINIKGKIIFESYLTSGTTYNYTNANNRKGTHTPTTTPEEGDLLIVYPYEVNENDIYYGDSSDSGKLYMWKYTNNTWADYNSEANGEETGNTYVSPNGHLILWDGDSWSDVGNIVGPEGKSYTIAVKYANDGTNGKVEITNDLEIPNAKWIGICVYEEGTTIPPITDVKWKWSLFKGQDGYGYEYIFKPTSTNDSASIPKVPQMPSGGNWDTTPNIIPDGWVDDPIEPTSTNKYIWMCWRKFDHSTQKWTDFMGVNNGTSATTNAKLWHFYVTDGRPGEQGEAGNGYQYKYIRYDNSVSYGSTTCTVTNASSDNPVFKIGNITVSSTNSAQGVDSDHTYEYRSERYGHAGSWSDWSDPVIIARYLDDSDIRATVQEEVSTTTSGIENSIRSSFQSTIDDVDNLKGYINPSTGLFSGTISEGTKTQLLSGYIKTNELSGEIKNVKLSGFGTDAESGQTRSFSEWVDYEEGQFTSVNQQMDALSGSVETAVSSIDGKAESSALTKLEADTHAEFAKLENTVANGQFLTDNEGYLLVDELAATIWYSQKSYLGNAGTTTWIMSEVFEDSGASYNFAPEVNSVDDLHNYDYSKWMIILRKPFNFSVYTYLDYTTTSYKDLLSDNITVHLNKNTGEYTIDDINPDIDNKLNGFYNPFTSSNVEPGVIIYAVVDLNNNSYSTEDDVNYTCSQLSWKVGLSDGYDGLLNNYGEKLCGYAYAKTNNIFTTPIYQYDGTTYSNPYDDVIMHAKLYGKYGYTLAVDKNDNVYKPKVAGVSASEDTPVHFVPKTTPFETIWNYFKNGTRPETTVIDDIMLDTYSDYYVLKHFSNISSEPYSYTLDITDNLKIDDKNEVSFSYDTETTPIFTNTHKYTGTEFSNNNGFRQITVGENTSTTTRYLTDSFQFLTTSANDTININCDYSFYYRNDTGITVTVSYWYDNETTKKNISFINDSSQRSSYPTNFSSVSGYVYDINDEPIVGANVSLASNPQIGTITDADGNYELTDVPAIHSSTLKFEYVGMQTIQTTVNGYNEINVYLSEGNDGYVVKNDTSGSGDDSTYGHYSKSITKNLFDGITIEPYRQLNVEISVQVSPVMNNVDFKYKVESTNKIIENGFNASTLSLSGEYGQDVIVSPSQNKTDTLLGEDKEDLGDGYANTLFTLKSRYTTDTREDTDFIFYSIKSIDKNIKINLDIVLEKGTLTNAGMISAYGTFKYVVIPMYFDEIDMLQIVSNLEHEGSSEFLFDERYWANDWDVSDVVDNYITISGQSLKSSTILDFNNAYDYDGEYYFTVLQVYETHNAYENSGTFYSRLSVSAVDPYFNWSTDGYTRTINHRYCNNIIDQVNVKISDRSIIEKFNENNRRRALDKYGNPASNYIDVVDSDRDKLIYSISELSSISQMVSNGIASTSIVTTTEDGAAIFYEQVDENGSKIYMNANTIGIYSDYFSLDDSGLEMRGNLIAKDENGIITAGVIGDDTADNDVKFFAGTNSEMQNRLQAPFRVYEDGSIYANQGYIGTAKITASGIGVVSNDGFVLIGDKGIEIRDKYDNYSIISPSEITLSAALKKRNAYIFDVWTWDDDSKLKTLKKDYGVYPTSLINEAFKECDIINTFNQGDTFTIPSSTSLIGRHITLMGGSALCSMVISAVEASGVGYSISMGNVADTYQFTDDCKFYENGGVSSSLKLSNEGVDLVGVGFGNNFKGFVVTNRFNVNTNYNYGADLRCLGMFSIDGSTIKSYTFNGQSGTISSSSSQYVTILTPFKINDSYIDKILVNISSESGNSTGITYNYSLSTNSNKMLSITVYSSSISKKFKITVFNFADVESLVNDPSTPPGVTKKEYKPSYTTSYYNISSSLSISYNSSYTYNIRLTVNGSTKKVEYELQSGSAYFTFASGSKTTSGNTTVYIGEVSAKSDNYTDSYRSGVIKVTLHSTTSGSGDSNKKTIITIPLEQSYYVEPSYGGNS